MVIEQPVRDALAVGAATGAYGISFGAVSTTAGLSLLQTVALSALLFSGASQFAFVGLVASGGGAAAEVATAVLLGTRNAFYGLRLAPLLRVAGPRRFAAAQVTIDETTAMALAQPDAPTARLAFWATGASVYGLWNLGTFVGALGARGIDPTSFGLDAAVPAAFVALLAPRMRGGEAWAVALAAGVVAIASTPFLPAGVPVLLAAAVALLVGVRR
jgi:predicted branched-subunit amino acid permease